MTIYLDSDGILQKCKVLRKGVLLIIAPTGTGKTMGIKNLVLENPKLYGKTIMVQPTKMAFVSIIPSMTPMQLIRNFLYKKKFDCRTLIIDEVHSLCVEYQTILYILQKTEYYKKIRVILMSATPNLIELESLFPLTVYTMPVITPFPINVKYTPIHSSYHGFASYRQMVNHVVELLKNYPHHHRVLVFLYTHDQCDKMALELKSFTSSYNQGKTFALYGGMDKQDLKTWHTFLENEKNFIVFSTNVAETSITIPNLSLIIDFGIRCIQQNNRIIYNHCPQSNLIQRSGRTGRTCSGTVLRCMNQEDFLSRPERDHPEYNWDMIILTILLSKHDPCQLLPNHIPISSILQKFKFYRILDENGKLDHLLINFIVNSPLLLKNSCHLYYFLKNKHKQYLSDPQFVLYLISIAIIDQMETRMSRIYYYSYDDLKINKNKFLDKLKKNFLTKQLQDELVLYINIFLSCMLNEKPVEISNAFSFNFRFLRQISSSITKLWHFIYTTPTQETWQLSVRRHVVMKTEFDLKRKTRFQIYQLRNNYIETLRSWFFINPLTPRFYLMNDLFWRPNFIVETCNCIIPPFMNMYNNNRCILMLSYDDTDIYQWFDPTHQLTNIITLSFTLYTFLPSPMNLFILNLNGNIKKAFFNLNYFRKTKELTRKKFKLVLEDIIEDVAYRPGFWKMSQSIQEFLSHFELFSKNKILTINR